MIKLFKKMICYFFGCNYVLDKEQKHRLMYPTRRCTRCKEHKRYD